MRLAVPGTAGGVGGVTGAGHAATPVAGPAGPAGHGLGPLHGHPHGYPHGQPHGQGYVPAVGVAGSAGGVAPGGPPRPLMTQAQAAQLQQQRQQAQLMQQQQKMEEGIRNRNCGLQVLGFAYSDELCGTAKDWVRARRAMLCTAVCRRCAPPPSPLLQRDLSVTRRPRCKGVLRQ
jgi:hypothetical protein